MPIMMPIAAVIQMDAAVVRPRTVAPSRKMTPAPRKPMPVMMPWPMRTGSLRKSDLGRLPTARASDHSVGRKPSIDR